MPKKKDGAAVKKRNWAAVLYPESLPSDWREQLQATGLPVEISPLHDRDTNADGSPKKPHYHVILCYSGPTSFNVVKKLTDQLGQPIPQALEQIRGYHRYLTHMDNPEKAQYDPSRIQTLNGFRITDFMELTCSEVTQIIKQLQAYIVSEKIYEYCDLLDYLLRDGLDTEYEVAISHTLVLNAYITSRRSKAAKIAEIERERVRQAKEAAADEAD